MHKYDEAEKQTRRNYVPLMRLRNANLPLRVKKNALLSKVRDDEMREGGGGTELRRLMQTEVF